MTLLEWYADEDFEQCLSPNEPQTGDELNPNWKSVQSNINKM